MTLGVGVRVLSPYSLSLFSLPTLSFYQSLEVHINGPFASSRRKPKS